MPIERRRLKRLPLAPGFELDQGDHRFFRLPIGGRRILETRTSHGSTHRTISGPLAAETTRQIGVTSAFLYALFRGEKSPEEYYAELRRQGIID